METLGSFAPTTEDLAALWSDFAADLYQKAAKAFEIPGPALNPVKLNWPVPRGFDENKPLKTLETLSQNFTTLLTLLTPSQEPVSYVKSMTALSEFLSQMALDSFENGIEFQTKWLSTLLKIGEQTHPYRFDDIDHSIFESFRTLYHQEFQKYFQIPPLGLPRNFQEKINRCMDTSNLFHSHLLELICLFGVVFEKSGMAAQEELGDMLLEGEIFQDSEKGYERWIKILEGHFMIWLQSDEHLKVLDNTIATFIQYKKARDAFLCEIIKPLPVPTHQEMDEVYKELYEIKKKVKAISRKLLPDER